MQENGEETQIDMLQGVQGVQGIQGVPGPKGETGIVESESVNY